MNTKLIAALAAVFLLAACTPSDLADARATLKGAGAAAKAYVGDQIETRREYRAGIRDADRAQYDALMGAARDAERNGDLETAIENWAAARALYTEHMPRLDDMKARVGEFFDDP